MPGKEPKVVAKAASKAAAPVKTAKKGAAVAKKAPKGNKNMPSKYVSQPKDFGVGRDTPFKRDISRFMRWPQFVTLQRKKRVIERRMKVPPTLNQFRQTLDRTTRTNLLKLLQKYKPENKKARKERLSAAAKAKKADPKKAVTSKAPIAMITGLQEVTRSIEKGTARLVVIASNVDPIELVLWMPTLCRAQKVPYAIVKDKARLGEITGMRNTACVAIKSVHAEDEAELASLVKSVKGRFLARGDAIKKKWGGLQMSLRSAAALRKNGRTLSSHQTATADAADE
jgi:large subunit ribosomal protein L7Ae